MKVLKRDFPHLETLVDTFGDAYSDAELRMLSRTVQRSFEIPAFESGIEALLRCEPCDVLECFRGWAMLSCNGRIPDLECDDETCFSGATVDALMTVAHVFGIRSSIRAFFLWVNSD